MTKGIGITMLFVCAVLGGRTSASPASGVTPTVLSRGTYEAFNVMAGEMDLDLLNPLPVPPPPNIEFKAKAHSEIDIVVRTHAYAVASHTGWHAHPGPVFITVETGTLTVYEYDDPCTPIEVKAGEGYVDTGRGHIVVNESGQPAVDVTVIIAPVGGLFRYELDPPAVECGP